MLAPGVVFRPHLQPSPWMRFNVTTCDNPRVLRWLEQVAQGAAPISVMNSRRLRSRVPDAVQHGTK